MQVVAQMEMRIDVEGNPSWTCRCGPSTFLLFLIDPSHLETLARNDVSSLIVNLGLHTPSRFVCIILSHLHGENRRADERKSYRVGLADGSRTLRDHDDDGPQQNR